MSGKYFEKQTQKQNLIIGRKIKMIKKLWLTILFGIYVNNYINYISSP